MNQTTFLDAHIHVWEYCLFNSFKSLDKAASLEEMVSLLKNNSINGWAVGVRFNQESLIERIIPERDYLDHAFGTQPAVIVRTCLHMLIMNTSAMEKFGCFSPNGIFLEADVFAMLNHLCSFLKVTPDSIIADGMRQLNDLGITQVIDMAMDRTKRSYFKKINFYTTDWSLLDDALGFKLFLDGGLGARTAALTEPYTDDPGNYGKLNYTFEELLSLVEKSHAQDKPVACHAIGDRAVAQFLRVIALSHHPGDRIEHVQYATHEQLDALSRLQIPVCIQPVASGEIPWARQRLGEKRMETAYAWNLMLQKGIYLLGGSDAPVDEADPRYAARLADNLAGNQHLDYEKTLQLFSENNQKFHHSISF